MAEDLLGPLREGPLPVLSPASSIRARGEQRRRRRAALSASAVVVVGGVLAAGAAVTLTGGGGGDELRPAPFASPAPSSSAPTPSAAPAPVAPVGWFLPDAFLAAADAARVEDPGWVVDEAFEPDSLTSTADPCGERRIPLDDRVRDQGEQIMSSRREAGGSSLHQEIYRYETAEDAALAFGAYEQQYARCASVPNPDADGPGWTTRSEVRRQELTPSGGSLLVRRIPCAPEGGCTMHFATYTMVVRHADAVTVVTYMIGEDGDPADEAEALLEAVQRQLARVVSG